MTDEERLIIADTYWRAVKTEPGQFMLEHLDALFLHPELYVPSDPAGSHVRIGEANVMRHIHGMVTLAANPKMLVKPPAPEEESI